MVQETEGVERRPSGANVAFLLIHGFCAAPDEVASLGEFLIENRIASFAVKVAGHGSSPEELAVTTKEDWLSSVQDGLDKVISWKTKYVFICGFSMGGALGVRLAARRKDIDGLFLIAPAIKTSGLLPKLVPLLKYFIKYRSVDVEENERIHGYTLPRFKYDREPLSAIHEVLKLMREVQDELQAVSIPILVIQGDADKTIPPWNASLVYERVSSNIKEIHLITGAEHVIPCHPSRFEAYPLLLQFIKKLVEE